MTPSDADSLITRACAEQLATFRAILAIDGASELAVPGVVAMDSGIDFPLFNSVLHTDLDPEKLDEAMAAVTAHFAAMSRPWMWWHRPDAKPGDLGDCLLAAGFEPAGVQPVMVRDSTEPPDLPPIAGLEIRPVLDAAALEVYLEVLAAAFGMPPLAISAFRAAFLAMGFGSESVARSWIGSLDGEPVATTAAFLHGDGMAGIYNVSTTEAARRKGIGAALTAAGITAALEAGNDAVALQSSEAGYRVYEQLGFVEICQFHSFMAPPR